MNNVICAFTFSLYGHNSVDETVQQMKLSSWPVHVFKLR